MFYLSVVIPAHNSRDTIEDCLKSIKNSVYKDYELLVVDDASSDNTPEIAGKYADKIIRLENNQGRAMARNIGIKAANGKVVVNIDSDIVINPDTLKIIADFLSKHSSVYAVTGLLSKYTPRKNFLSDYKNLYMYYTFSSLPGRVDFLFGSVCAFRNRDLLFYSPEFKYGVDTELGQRIFNAGGDIAFLRELEVTHLKKYNISSFVKKEFLTPFFWADILLRYKNKRNSHSGKVVFAHALKSQVVSLIIGYFIFVGILGKLIFRYSLLWVIPLFFIWAIINYSFFLFIYHQRGGIFAIKSAVITLVDTLIKGLGVVFGMLKFTAVQIKNRLLSRKR